MSKGSKRRPMRVPKDKFEDNWEKVFGNGKKPVRKDKHNSKAC